MKPTIKKLLISALVLSLALSLVLLPVSASDGVSAFPDIDDPEVGAAVEVLRVMGVIGGDEHGNYRPEGTLTRAEFCKLAILVMDQGENVGPYETRTIFTDVASTHWARGYINLAVNTEVDGARLILGMGDGRFYPDQPITYDQAVTILLRMLGYGKQIVNSWPASAEAQAAALGLDAGVGAVSGDGPITRAQAAILFRNLLLTPMASGSDYASTLGSAIPGAIILSTGVPASDGSPAVTLSTQKDTPIKPAAYMPSPFMLGIRGTALLDSDGRFLTFIPDAGGKTVTLTVESASENAISGIDRTKISVPKSTRVLRDGEEYIYGDVYEGLDRPGLVVTVVYTSAGSIDYIFVRQAGAISEAAVVAASDGLGAFASVTGASAGCRIVKNGSAVTKNALKKWDVGVYDQATDTLYVSDFRLTGLYEAASPSAYAPGTITLLGRDFEVLPSAFPDFEDIKVGDVVTALFSPGGKVAAVRPQKDVGANAIGILRSDSTPEAATVDLINSPLDKDAAYVTASFTGNIDSYAGQIVSVTGSTRQVDRKTVSVLYLTRQASDAAGNLDLKTRTVGGRSLADNAAVFERVGNKSAVTPIALADVNLSRVPESQVIYTHENSDGALDILVLDDVTGDRYYYGFLKTENKVTQAGTVFGDVWNDVTTVTYGPGEKDFASVVGSIGGQDRFGGVAVSLSKIGDYNASAGYAALTSVSHVTQANFNASARTFTYGNISLPVADAVHCYNSKTGAWFKSLEEALIYSNSFTVYYDRTPSTGGKVRIVVSE